MSYQVRLGKGASRFPVNSPLKSAAACVIGLGILVVLLIGYTQQREFAQVAQKTLGTVIGVTSGSKGYATIEYEALDGQTYRLTASASSLGSTRFKVGQQMAVLYDPAAPRNAELAVSPTPFLPCVNIFLFVMALLLVSSGVYSLVYALLPLRRSDAFDLKNKRGG